MKSSILMSAAMVAVLATMPVLGQGTYNIYGIHFYGTGAETTIKNGKGMYSVEMLYTSQWPATNQNNERAKLLDIKNKGFKVILRLDYSPTQTVPALNDWTGRYYYALYSGQIALKMNDIVDMYIIGNEVTTAPDANCRDAVWYSKCYNGYDTNCCYDQIHANDAAATVLLAPQTAWPYFIAQINGNNVDWITTVQNNVDQSGGQPVIDGYALHSYSGKEYYSDNSTATEDPRFSDVTGLHSFIQFMKGIYAKHGTSKPVYITETNTFWFANGFSDQSYRANWMKEAFQTVDEWNQSADLKINALCWFTYSTLGITDPNSDIYGNALMRTNNALLNTARSDFSWVTANTNITPGSVGSTLKFQAENYTNSAEWISDVGVEGTDYHDTDNANTGGKYRNGSVAQGHVDIDLLPDFSGFFVGWMAAGEWLRYETIGGGRNYRPRLRYARGVSGSASVTFSVDGTNVATMSLPATANWSTYTVSGLGTTFFMSGGYHTLKVTTSTGSLNIDYFELVP